MSRLARTLFLAYTVIVLGCCLGLVICDMTNGWEKKVSDVNITKEQILQIQRAIILEDGHTNNDKLTKLIGYQIKNLSVCTQCTDFEEWSRTSASVTYPVVVQDVVDENNNKITLVVGQVGWHAGAPNRMYINTKTVVYVNSKIAGRIYGISDGKLVYSNPVNETWVAVNHESARSYMLRSAIKTLQDSAIKFH